MHGADIDGISAEPPGRPDHGGVNVKARERCWWVIARAGEWVRVWTEGCYQVRLNVVMRPP